MKRRVAILNTGILGTVLVLAFAPVASTQTSVYVGIYSPSHQTNWESLSCKAFGIGAYYDVWHGYVLGCPSAIIAGW